MKLAIIISLVAVGCGGPIPAPATDAAPDIDSPPPSYCSANMMYCDKPSDADGSALFVCNADGTAGIMTERCTYCCSDDACCECEPNSSVCNGDDLAICGANGKVAGITSCMGHGCDADGCHECTPDQPFCEGASSVACDAGGH